MARNNTKPFRRMKTIRYAWVCSCDDWITY